MSKELVTAGVGLVPTGASGTEIARSLNLIREEPLSPDADPAEVYIVSKPLDNTKRTIRSGLNRIAGVIGLPDPNEGKKRADRVPDIRYRYVAWENLRFQHTSAIKAALARDVFLSYATVNRNLSFMRMSIKTAWRLDLISAQDYLKAVDIENIKGTSVLAGRHIAEGELGALLAVCGNDAGGIRDAAIISIWYATGMRRAELAFLDLDSYEPDGDQGKFLVHGKNNTQRELWIENGPLDALGDWLKVRGDEPGPLFWGIGNRNQGNRLTTQALYYVLSNRSEMAGVKEITPHDFRRTFAGEMIDRGADIVTVQQMMGHANVTTTARYDRRDERAKKRAAGLIHVPYTRRTLKVDD